MDKLNILGLCAGNGVSLFPFKKTFNILGNIEPRAIFYSRCQSQWVANFAETPMVKKLVDFTEPVDVIIGNPDCGHSSVLTYSRSKSLKDAKENASLALYIQGIKKYSPKFFLLENLQAMLNSMPEDLLAEYFSNYKIIYIKGSVLLFGNSQATRERLVIIGIRKDILPEVNDLAFTKLKENFTGLTCQQLIGDLENYVSFEEGHVREDNSKVVCLWYKGEKVNLSQAREIWVGPLKKERCWPGAYNTKTQPGVFKLFPDRLPLTVRKQNRQFNYLGLSLTPREMARIQGIPDTFKLHVTPEKKDYWINKARATVSKQPPYEIALWFKYNILKNYEKIHSN